MPVSRSSPEESYQYFYSKEPVTHVSKILGVDKKTLKRWWESKFGGDEYSGRVRVGMPPKLSEEERKAKKREQNKRWLAKGDNLARMRASQAEHRGSNKERYRKLQQLWYREHLDDQKAYAKRYRQANKERMRVVAKRHRKEFPEVLLWKLSKQRAKRSGLPFDLTPEYIKSIIPDVCPITLLPFEIGDRRPVRQSMTLDKIYPSMGYVPGNVAVISRFANTLKQDCIDPTVFDRLADFVGKL